MKPAPDTSAANGHRSGVAAPALAVDVRGLVKRYGDFEALRGIDLAVPPGGVQVILGPNGAGKSTFLRVLGTTLLPDEGTARVAGFDVEDDPVGARTATGLVLGEERAWYWRLSGAENLAFFARLHGHRRRAAHEVSRRLLEIVRLTGAADRRVEGYSSGMRARLAVARALLGDPDVLLFDEPTRALDPVGRSELRALAAELIEAGRAVLWATHDLHEAASLPGPAVVLHEGRIAASVADGADAAHLEAALREAIA